MNYRQPASHSFSQQVVIDGVDIRLGYETRRFSEGQTALISVTILKHFDLVLPKDLHVEIALPFNTPSSLGSAASGNTPISTPRIPEGEKETLPFGRVKLLDVDMVYYFPPNCVVERNKEDVEIVLPWLQTAIAPTAALGAVAHKMIYTLAMWFFSIRMLLKKTTETDRYEAWRGCVLLSPTLTFHAPTDSASGMPNIATTMITAGVGRSRGRRGYMEDVDFVFEFVKVQEKRHVSIFGVLDGHGGNECAQFIADDIPMKITSLLRSTSSGSAGGSGGLLGNASNSSKKSSSGPGTADLLYQAFLEIDEEYIKSNTASHIYQPSNAGSTANLCLFDINENRCYIANTGDTRAILHREQHSFGSNHTSHHSTIFMKQASSNATTEVHAANVVDLSFDRKATDAEEIVRIMREGGFVINGRVLGSLAVSRAFGDVLLKVPSKFTTNDSHANSSGNKRFRYVVADPEITSFTPCSDDRFMVIATDGLWDVMSSVAVDAYVVQAMLKEEVLLPMNPQDLATDSVDYSSISTLINTSLSKEEIKVKLNKIASTLTTHAIDNMRSMDNVTVMILLVQSDYQGDDVYKHNSHSYVITETTSTTHTSSHAFAYNQHDSFISKPVSNHATNTSSAIVSSIASSSASSYSQPQAGKTPHTSYSSNTSTFSSHNNASASNGTATNTVANKKKKVEEEDDDDLMSFLKDDSNF